MRHKKNLGDLNCLSKHSSVVSLDSEIKASLIVPSKNKAELASNLLKLREAINLNQANLAKMLDISQPTIALLENPI